MPLAGKGGTCRAGGSTGSCSNQGASATTGKTADEGAHTGSSTDEGPISLCMTRTDTRDGGGRQDVAVSSGIDSVQRQGNQRAALQPTRRATLPNRSRDFTPLGQNDVVAHRDRLRQHATKPITRA